jgi:Uncharacterized protein conserved in bacteria (DUF2252)
MSFRTDNRDFEAWLKRHCRVVQADLNRKHQRMRRDPFSFLRGTFFRWANTIENICPELTDAPAVLSVGDVHVENFGTWRDAEGRLVWGVNDFDEAAVTPYPFDLVRLATSAALAPRNVLGLRAVAAAILRGYREGLAEPTPTLLDKADPWMAPLVTTSAEDRKRFWKKIERCPPPKAPNTLPRAIRAALRKMLPRDAKEISFATRIAGCGSLGRPRYIARGDWRDDHVVREAKALVPSAWLWAHDDAPGHIRFMDLATGRYRSPDPYLHIAGKFIYRRLAADSHKIDIAQNPRLTIALFEAMGFDLGAIHAADPRAKAVARDLKRRPRNWLLKAAKAARKAVEADYAEWTRPRRR